MPCLRAARPELKQRSGHGIVSRVASKYKRCCLLVDSVMQARASAAHPSGLSSADATARRLRSIGYSRLTMCGFTRGPTANFSMYLSTMQTESSNALTDYGTSSITLLYNHDAYCLCV